MTALFVARSGIKSGWTVIPRYLGRNEFKVTSCAGKPVLPPSSWQTDFLHLGVHRPYPFGEGPYKTLASWKESSDKPRLCIKKQKRDITDKGPHIQIYGFSSSHVRMWELNLKEDWAQNLCFWIVVLEKTLVLLNVTLHKFNISCGIFHSAKNIFLKSNLNTKKSSFWLQGAILRAIMLVLLHWNSAVT